VGATSNVAVDVKVLVKVIVKDKVEMSGRGFGRPGSTPR
jgi:hypothetical protein